MSLGSEEDKVKSFWDVCKSKERKKKDGTQVGCWVKLRFFGSCISSRSKVDSSVSGTSNHFVVIIVVKIDLLRDLTALWIQGKFYQVKDRYFGFKGTCDRGCVRDQPAAPAVSSSTTSNTESNSSLSKLEEEVKVATRLRKFTFNDLKLATRNFRPESLLGEGGFGCVFKGWIEENGTAPVKPGTGLTVAVKTLNHDGLQGHKEWLAEVNFLGSLPLPWSMRMKIALGAAKGLAFLHEEAERPVIYRDFKTSNILLDADYNAKLSDFGLAKDGPEGDKTHVSTRVMGTYGYAAPEYVMTGHLTSRSDVYSFGVVLLEMITGRRSMDKKRPNGEHNLVEWARPHLGERRRFYRLIDPRLEGHFSIKGAQKAAQLAAHCLSRDPKARPLMSEVVDTLKPLPNLKDMASSSYYFQTMQADRVGSSPNAKNGVVRSQAGLLSRNGQQRRSFSIPNNSLASPFHRQSPKPSGKP
ncbi:hypothetical protein OIU85_005405 [Salix viminalis]|uniref:Protein kinase domain-containing protein n=1 Tax=Salix viminalis TaxID=40686 RepID=A0A9Q0STD4_SALVM|nr:hypothetical protein OIU85_005405 [Salix viminalis]